VLQGYLGANPLALQSYLAGSPIALS